MDNYYEVNAKEFIENTINCDMNELYQFFLKYMPKEGIILDLGFGSGRDMIYFNSLGYFVKGIDPTDAFVSQMKNKGFHVEKNIAQNMTYTNMFDGIWACASLLHIKSDELNQVFLKCAQALKKNGVIYASFKYGDFEGVNKGRYFTNMTEEALVKYLDNTGLRIVETSITSDVRSDRIDEKWLNCILKKRG